METQRNGLSVVIVDDAMAMRSVLRSILSSDGYRVLADLASGAHLLETIKRMQPHLVCLDFSLPDVDGLSLLKEIHAAHRDVAVVMITGSEDAQVEIGAAEAGAAGFIRKPFSQAQILGELRQVAHAQALLIKSRQGGGENSQVITAGPPVHAVIADDSDTMRQLLTAILTEAGVMVLGEASNGEEAVRLVEENRPELVFLDYAMPGMNGLDALKQIIATQPGIRAMMVTAAADRDLVRQCAQAGARGYILKPYRPDKVIAAVKQLIATA